jgi:hypothetical protein
MLHRGECPAPSSQNGLVGAQGTKMRGKEIGHSCQLDQQRFALSCAGVSGAIYPPSASVQHGG